ncbi:hypothetical protein EV177_001985 [Coemansia sp. RSA 1804]|nr:hypothetical protein EV177_001985 [Coemansia sp. RSA 1804]
MKFGKTIETNAKELPEEWQPYIIQYKLLKKNIKKIVVELDTAFKTLNLTLPDSTSEDATSSNDDKEAGKATGTKAIPLELQPGESYSTAVISSKVDNSSGEPTLPNDNEDIQMVPKPMENTEETQVVVVRLETDQLFFDQLLNYINRMQSFEQKYTKQYKSNVVSLGSDLTTVTSPFKHDFEIWREIFRLYIDADVWDHSDGDFRPANPARECQNRFAKFTKHIEKIGLTPKFRDPHSARILMSFYKLNIELSYLRLLQEMNELATRKIIKKHDKRTHLIAKTQFPQIVNIDATSLTKALIYTVYNDLVGVVPQINDYLCPMCLNIAWRPLRLDCGHVFCSRCVVKASRRRIFDCPLCRSKRAVYNASVTNIDTALLNFLKLYFPKEIKEKQREIQQEISEEESLAIMQAYKHERSCTIM